LSERFSAYGVGVGIPEDWRIEFAPKSSRTRGDVAFHSPANNVFFVSWGKLENAQRSFKSLEHQRDESVKRVKRNPNVSMARVESTSRGTVSTHEAIISRLVAQKRRGMMSRYQEPPHDIWMAHFYCPESSRYYIAYWNLKDGEEFPDPEPKFLEIVHSLVCHR
jgi:hypothetical protein